MTRTTIAHLFHSLDGVVESPNLWQFDAFGPEEGQLMSDSIGPVTDVVIGRVLWQEWSQHWPAADGPFADWINPVRKHVVSSSMSGDLGWNSTAVDGDPVEYVRGLRDGDGGDISVIGGITTVRSMFLAGLVDELTLTTHPVLAGSGRRLFDDVPTTRLRMLRGRATGAGNAILTYALRPAD